MILQVVLFAAWSRLKPVQLDVSKLISWGHERCQSCNWRRSLDLAVPAYIEGMKGQSQTHRINVWYIYIHLVDLYAKCRWIYHTLIIDPRGKDTLPKTNVEPENGGLEDDAFFKLVIFWFHVSFRGSTQPKPVQLVTSSWKLFSM